MEEQIFINDNIVQIGQYLGRIERGKLPNKSTVENLKKIITPLWIKFLKNLRETRVIWEEEEKLKLQTEERNNEELSKLNAEVQRAKANFKARMGKSNLGSPAEEEKNNNFAEAVPAKINNSYMPHINLMTAVRRKINSKPNQPLHNNQNAVPAKINNSYMPNINLMTAVRRKINSKPNQPLHNNQNAVPANVNNIPQSRKNLLARLAKALEND